MTQPISGMRSCFAACLLFAALVANSVLVEAQEPKAAAKKSVLKAGVAKVDITNHDAGPVNDPLFVKALVLDDGSTSAVIITVDAVSIGEIGYIKNDYLPKVRAQLETELGIPPKHVLVNTSHCHGIVCDDVEARTVQAVREAKQKMFAVTVGAGRGHEDRIMENRRIKLKSGKDADVRHAYSLPPDDEVVGVGPVDPQIGIVRLDKENGQTLAVVYNFACHPIMGVPNGGNTADITGFASKVIEDNLSDGTIALFIQGCGGDINPAFYKETHLPRSAEPLGNMLGLSTLKALRSIKAGGNQEFKIVNESLALPRRFDAPERLERMQAEQLRLLQSLTGTSLNLKTFMPLAVKYNLDREFPSFYSHRYMHETLIGREDLKTLDEGNREKLAAYIKNIQTMEQLTRIQTNMALVRKHQKTNEAAGKRTLDVELVGLRLGDFVLATSPGELTVQIGLNLKKASPHKLTFIAGYTNGYIYYAPTSEQILSGEAQEDCDCLLAPEWQPLFEKRALEVLKKL